MDYPYQIGTMLNSLSQGRRLLAKASSFQLYNIYYIRVSPIVFNTMSVQESVLYKGCTSQIIRHDFTVICVPQRSFDSHKLKSRDG